MPRAKVRPENRQRSVRACIPCKTSKIRCDATDPCGPCSKRERIALCVYSSNSRTTGPRKRRRLSPASQPAGADDTVSDVSTFEERHEDERVRSAQDEPVESVDSTIANPPLGCSGSCKTESRMLFNSKGEKLYVGENASLSFLQFLRSFVRASMGPSSFTEHQWKDTMLEVSVAHDESPVESAVGQAELRALIQLYREAAAGILDLFTSSEIDALLERHLDSSPSGQEDGRSRGERAAFDTMLAIGSQCCGQDHDATRYFSLAQQFALGNLCDPSLSLVRVFLLMAFYLLGAIHRNGAYMYLGIATKAACALGIHRKDLHGDMSPQDCLSRERTWNSVIILDTIVSTILGRPRSTVVQLGSSSDICRQISPCGDTRLDADQSSLLTSNAVRTICLHIIELEQQSNKKADPLIVKSFLARLQTWNQTLPPELKKHSLHGNATSSYERELFLGATHVACSYYFTIILVTRPFLIDHLVLQMRRRRRSSIEQDELDLAQACIDAARFMADAGIMAVRVSNNMRLLKAWSFAAGLVLGFSLFANTHAEPDQDIAKAFRNSITVLEQLGNSSPQARHYCHILSTFGYAIDARRAQLYRERPHTKNQLVTQIITAEFNDNDAPLSAATSSLPQEPATTSSFVDRADLNESFSGMFDSAAEDMPEILQLSDELSGLPFMSDNLYIDWGIWPEV